MDARKFWANVIIVVFLTCAIIETIPQTTLFHWRLKNEIDFFIDTTGIWQGEWNLFAPDVDKENSRISANITYEGNHTVQWESPNWMQYSRSERFINFREMEFYDSIRLDANRGAWESFADYLVRTNPCPAGPGLRPVKVILTRHWCDIPAPRSGEPLPRRGEIPISQRYDFFTREY